MDHFRFSHPTCVETRLRGVSQQQRENPYTGYFPTSPLFSSYSPHPSPVPATLLREGMQTIADQLPTEGNRKKAARKGVKGKESWKSHSLSDLSLPLCLSFSDCNKR